MENVLLKKLIINFRKGDMQAFTPIYSGFEKLIDYYSRKIGDEDSRQELIIFFIETLYNIELSNFCDDRTDRLNRYISVSIRNKYIYLSKKHQSEMLNYTPFNDCYADFDDNIDKIFIKEILNRLSHKQRAIIVYKYIYGYSDVEISELFGISRQAVNRLKNRAKDTIREMYY